MSLDLIPATKQILHQVEDLTKKKVKFIKENALPGFAKVKVARKNMPYHIIFYKELHGESINHTIAHECRHIIRIFNVPESRRVMPFMNPGHREIALRDLKEYIDKMTLSPGESINSISKWFDALICGVVSEVTSFPPDLMIEKWLYDNVHELRNYQKKMIKKHCKDTIGRMSNELKAITPGKIYNSCNTMYYAYFRIIGSYLNYDFLKSYDPAPFKVKGEKLVALTEENYKNNFDGDIAKSNEWANFLNLSKWFIWVDFEKVTDDYEKITWEHYK